MIGVGILVAIISSASSSANRAPNLGYAGNGYSGSRDQGSFSCAVRYGNIQRVDFVGYSLNY